MNSPKKIYNYFVRTIKLDVGSKQQFTVPQTVVSWKYDITFLIAITGNTPPTSGNLIFYRRDVNGEGNSIETAIGYLDFSVLATSFTYMNGTMQYKVNDLTPNDFFIENKLDVDIVCYPVIDVLVTPVFPKEP